MTPPRSRHWALIVIATAMSGAPLNAQPAAVHARYEKREVRIPMRDGVMLFTSIYVPRDTTRRFPIMFTRTPYAVAPYGDTAYRASLGPSAAFEREGFIFVYQDVRGRYMSEGTYAFMTPHQGSVRAASGRKGGPTDESTDTYDSIAWLLQNLPRHNVSAPGASRRPASSPPPG